MAEHRSSEAAVAAGAPELRRKRVDSEGDDDGNREEDEREEIEERVGESPLATESQRGELRSFSGPPVESNSETLAAVPSSVLQDRSADLQGSATTLNSSGKAESKDTVEPPEKEIIAREAEAAHAPPTQLQVSMSSTPSSELSPNSVTQSLSPVPSPTIQKQKMSPPKVNNMHAAVVEKKTPSGGKTLSAISVARTSASDGYNWRKYGQKQVKSPTGSRSYYRCTHSNCSAKKIECCDHSGHVIEIVHKSEHSHDPPRKTNSIRESKVVSSNEPSVKNSVPEQHTRVMKDSDPSISSKALQEVPCIAEKKQQNSSNISDNGKIILKEDLVNEPEPKKRMKKGDLTNLDSPVKPGKKPNLVVHAAGDVGISGDGYRWRKYGQKMVKGNQHPRNYYRCTSAGCPVRKHIENAVDNSNAVTITYKGVHDHDMPVPKKRHGPPSAPLVAAAAPAAMNNLQLKKPDSPQNLKNSTQWSVDTEGELTGEAMDLGGEKAMESARTLLSIGFEIKPC
ncbi:WRKY domain [Sesbania bispinosa]|nr:WRKY domain [Sesbania bispinosa]